jgi:hypothetical protein
MTDDLVKRKLTIDPMPRKDLAAPPPIGYVARADYEALTAERDNYKLCALHSGDVVEAAEAEIDRLRNEIAHLKSEDGYIQAFIEGQKAMPKGVFTIVDSPELATLQADNARLRDELTKAADSLDWADAHLKDAGVVSANVRYGARDARAALNTGKEVMPDEARTTRAAHDIGPGDQAVAGAAAYPALREAIHKMVGLYETGDRSTYSACPQSAILAIAFLDDYEARNCPAPKLLVDDCDIALTWEVGGWKLYQYCDAEESISFRWIGTPIAARPEPVAGAAHPPAVPFGAQPGTKIVFHGIGGYEAENEKARSVLQVGSTYTLLELDVGGWRSSLSIKEAPGMWFNTVMFQPEPVAGAAPVTVLEAAQVLEENVTSPQYQDALQEIMLHGLSPYKAHEIIGGFLHALAQKDGE